MTKVGGLDDWHGFLGLPVYDVRHTSRPERIGCSRQHGAVSMLPLRRWLQQAGGWCNTLHHICSGHQGNLVASTL